MNNNVLTALHNRDDYNFSIDGKDILSASVTHHPFREGYKFDIETSDISASPKHATLASVCQERPVYKDNSKKVVQIKDYIINENATVIFWEDGTKTVVKKTKEDKFDKRIGLLIAYFQKNCGMTKTKANRYLDGLVVTEKTKKEE